MNSKAELVKSFFANPEGYLRSNFNIRIRAEVIKGFVGNLGFRSILDVGCGNGAISIPLVHHDNHLTLVDFSSTMLSIANNFVPSELSKNVRIINEDFMYTELPLETYDLIICLGVLAHVDSPINCINKMVSLLEKNGSIIIQNSDARHPVGFSFNYYSKFQSLLRGRKYSLNHLSDLQLTEMFYSRGMILSAVYRYNFPIPGMARVLSNNFLYRSIKIVYGGYNNNRFSRFGAECIYHFKKI